MTKPATVPTSYTVRQAAAKLNVAVTTIRYHVNHRNLRAVRIEGRLYFLAEELARFERERSGPGNPTWGNPPKKGKHRKSR